MIQPTKTRAEFAAEYNVKPRTFRRWLKKANIELPSGYITPKYQRLIYDTFGMPEKKPKQEEEKE